MIYLVLFFLFFNYLISRLVILILIRTSMIVVDNYESLKDYVPEINYKHYLEIKEDPNCLNQLWLNHLPIHNLYQLYVFGRDLAFYNEKLINKNF